MIFSPAGFEFCAIHLFPRGTRIASGYDRIVFINDNRAEVAPQAGTLVGTPYSQIQKIMMPVGSHSEVYGKTAIKEAWFVMQQVRSLRSLLLR
jgi:hypothetical protein